MEKVFLFLTAFVVLGTAEVPAQKDPSADLREWERQQRERDDLELEKRQKEGDLLLSGTRFEAKPDKTLLPDGNGSWVLHIVTTGGFSGRGLPTVTITSNADFACGESESLRFLPLDPVSFQPLAQVIGRADFNVDRTSPKNERSFRYVCNDCYFTRLFLTRREANGKVRFYRSVSDKMKFINYAESFKLIKQRSTDLADCTR